jgi:hypothetical protein
MTERGWIGVDLDGTLAHYAEWTDGHIGEPIPAMVDRVKAKMDEGVHVRIFTARVGGSDQLENGRQRKLIWAWCRANLGVVLPVTATKDYNMIELWDDRCKQVIPNTGKFLEDLPR